MAIALIAGRHFDDATGYSAAVAAGASIPTLSERNLPLKTPTISNAAVLEQLRRSAQDPDVVVRHLAGYARGQCQRTGFTAAAACDADRRKSAVAGCNAAIGLARNGSVDAVPTLIELLATSSCAVSICSGLNARSGI